MENKFDIAKTIDSIKDTDTGKAADKTTSLVFRTINAALSPLEKWVLEREYSIQETKKLLAEKLENVPVKNIITPPSYIAVPALQAISYCMDNNELRDMYAELLKTAMNIETTDNVHPTYVEIIKQLSPYEALVFKKLVDVLVQPCIGVIYKNKTTGASYPIQDIVAFSDLKKYPLVATQIALENLERLRLIEINKNSKYANFDCYNQIKESLKEKVNQFINDNSNNLNVNDYEVVYNEYIVLVRGFGQFFARACLGVDFSNID